MGDRQRCHVGAPEVRPTTGWRTAQRLASVMVSFSKQRSGAAGVRKELCATADDPPQIPRRSTPEDATSRT